MEQLARSLGNFALAMPLFGLQQVANSVRQSDQGVLGGDAANALNDVTSTALQHCGETARRTFESGEQLQQQMLDMAFQSTAMGGRSPGAPACQPWFGWANPLTGAANASPNNSGDPNPGTQWNPGS